MKRSLTALCLISALLLSSAEIKLDNHFRDRDAKTGSIKSWRVHPWSGYKPFPTLQLAEDKGGKGNILEVRNVLSKHGTMIKTSKMYPGVSGDTVDVTIRARGKGTLNLTLYQYGQKPYRHWNLPLPTARFTLTDEWKTFTHRFTLANGPAGETGFYEFCFGCRKGNTMDIAFFSASREKGKYTGDVKIPMNWTVFAPMDKNFVPAEKDLLKIPAVFNKVKGRAAHFAADKLDFAPALNGTAAGKCGWAFANISSVGSQKATLAAGGDWWMKVYLNGKLIFDTTKDGNILGRVSSAPYRKLVQFKKGSNILAVKLISGSSSSDFYLKNAQSLRAGKGKLTLSRTFWLEDFDGTKVRCTGKPVLIKGNPTPGLLTLTGQGVFTADKTVRIVPLSGKTSFAAPGENEYFLNSVRIQNFGRTARKDGSLSFVFTKGKQNFRARIVHRNNSNELAVSFLSGSKSAGFWKIPCRLLPADFLFGADSQGNFMMQVNSLVDSSTNFFHGEDAFFRNWKNMRSFVEIDPPAKGKTMEVVLDNFLYGMGSTGNKLLKVPFMIERNATFDPVKEGWKLVFSDEFNGNKVDEKKWKISPAGRKHFASVKDGILSIKADVRKDGKGTESVQLISRENFLFGYFEARLRFRCQSGWWSAFWLWCEQPSNSFMNGLEIDIYEDYYLSRRKKDGPYGTILDHNLHTSVAGVVKSFNYHTELPGSLHDFHVIACKWTPFEISYYLNGRLMHSQANHSPHDSVTFDAINHSNCIVPLNAYLSGCTGQSGGDFKLGKFPDYFKVDYIRIYEYPRKNLPQVTARFKGSSDFLLMPGEKLKIDVKAKAAKGNKIKAVYLMDSGYLLDYKTKPPYDFELPFTEAYFKDTQFQKPGRTGVKPSFQDNIHAISVFVQDDKGNVAFTKPEIRYVGGAKGKNTPYKGKAAVIPGELRMTRFDEGGAKVAYFDKTPKNMFSKTYRPHEGPEVTGENGALGGVAPGEWLRFTVDVKKTGRYRIKFHYGTPLKEVTTQPVYMLAGRKLAARFYMKPHKATHWGIDSVSTAENIRLKKGRETLMFIFANGLFNASKVEFIYLGE